ncbi:hypothetical protein [Salibacterium salarium]|nr:hypothetical protein [Salibacterium salarium]
MPISTLRHKVMGFIATVGSFHQYLVLLLKIS